MRFTLFIVFVIGFNCLLAQSSSKKILFVGNSYTYFWNLPKQVELMALAKEHKLEIRQSTAGGVNWGQHWRGEKDLNTRDIILNGGFDYVVLQNHSMSTIQRQDSMMIYGKKFAQLIRDSGAEPILYMTWSRKWNPLMQSTISKGYTALGKQIDAIVLPIGELWQKSRTLMPDLDLYDPDGSHPNAIGTYLTACAFFKLFTNEASDGLSHRLAEKNQYNELIYYNFVPRQTATFLQELTDTTISKGIMRNKQNSFTK